MAINPNRTQLDQQQLLQRAFDEVNDRLRTDATFSGDIDVDLTVEINAADGDSVLTVGTEDGTLTGVQHVVKVDSNKNLIVKDVDVVTALATSNTTLAALLSELNQKTEPSDVQNTRLLSSATDSVSVPGVSTAANQATAQATLESIDSKLTSPLTVDLPGSATASNQVLAQVSLSSIDSKLTSPLTVSGTVSVGDLNASKDDVAIAGTENGTASGVVRHFVNNRRGQILAAHDRVQDIVYADFGTKNQRITQINYTSATFAGIVAAKTINYTLVGNRYRLDNIIWTVT